MLKVEEFFLLRDLHEQGLSISEMSRQAHLNRRTVRKYVQSMKPPQPVSRKGTSVMDDYKEYITERLGQYPLSAKRLLREIKALGYGGEYTTVKVFVRSVRPKIGVPAVFRYETEPGRQAQVDWAELGRVEIDGKPRKLYCFAMILGYSRQGMLSSR